MARGSSIEDKVIGYLERREGVKSVIDVSKERPYQAKGIDLLVESVSGSRKYGVEVKGDYVMHNSGNFFFETESNDVRKTPGWFIYSEADVLAYVSVHESLLFLMDFPGIRRWVTPRIGNFKTRRTGTKGESGSVIYHTTGILVPRSFLFFQVSGSISEIRLDEDTISRRH